MTTGRPGEAGGLLGFTDTRGAMDIRIENETELRIPREHVITRITQALNRAVVRPANARITFSDVNGPKGGADIRCALLLELPGHPPIVADRVATTPRLAFDASYARIARQLEAERRRWQASRRRPKKYFAAMRLLA